MLYGKYALLLNEATLASYLEIIIFFSPKTEQTPLHYAKDESVFRLISYYEQNVKPDPTKVSV